MRYLLNYFTVFLAYLCFIMMYMCLVLVGHGPVFTASTEKHHNRYLNVLPANQNV